MRLIDMKRSAAVGVVVVAAALLASACDATSTISTSVAIPVPGGPCAAGIDQFVGESGLTVVHGGQQVSASLNYETIQYCPGHKYEGQIASEGDGFLANLDEAVVVVEPGALVEIRGSGYPEAELATTAEVEETYVDPENGRVWQVRVPDGVGDHEIRLNLEWAQGRAQYAFVARTQIETFGPVRLVSERNGLRAVGDDGSQTFFHLGGPVQGYGDGMGGIVYQSLHEQRWVNNLDVMWLPLGEDIPKIAVPAGDDSIQLQGISAGRVLTIGATQDASNGINPDERSLALTDIASGESTVLLTVTAEEDLGIGRASMVDGKIVVSMRSRECTWLRFLDVNGQVLNEPHNPQPKSDICSPTLMTGAVFLDHDTLAYVETEPGLEYGFDDHAYPHSHVAFTRPPVQAIVVVDLATGETTARVEIEPAGMMVQWLEPLEGEILVSLGTLGDAIEEARSAAMPILPRTPTIADLGSDFGFEVGRRAHPAGSIAITGANGDVRHVDEWLTSAASAVRRNGLCSAVLSELDIGPPSGVTGLGADVPITIYEITEAADETRAAIVSAASACDYQALFDLATQDRPSPAFFSGPNFDQLARYWEDLENSGEPVLATLVGLLEYMPTGQNPFRWDSVRGDVQFSNATVSIDADGNWTGFQIP